MKWKFQFCKLIYSFLHHSEGNQILRAESKTILVKTKTAKIDLTLAYRPK